MHFRDRETNCSAMDVARAPGEPWHKQLDSEMRRVGRGSAPPALGFTLAGCQALETRTRGRRSYSSSSHMAAHALQASTSGTVLLTAPAVSTPATGAPAAPATGAAAPPAAAVPHPSSAPAAHAMSAFELMAAESLDVADISLPPPSPRMVPQGVAAGPASEDAKSAAPAALASTAAPTEQLSPRRAQSSISSGAVSAMASLEPFRQRLWGVEHVAKVRHVFAGTARSLMAVRVQWLRAISLGQYVEAFVDASVDGEMLAELARDATESLLEHEVCVRCRSAATLIVHGAPQIGVKRKIHRIKIIREIRKASRACSPRAPPGLTFACGSCWSRNAGPSRQTSICDPFCEPRYPATVASLTGWAPQARPQRSGAQHAAGHGAVVAAR